MACRSEAQKVAGITDAQHEALALPRKKGFNYRKDRPDTEATKIKKSETLRRVHAENPAIAIERGKKIRGDFHRLWNGGSSKLNKSIRQMTENRKWMDAVKARDGKCVECGALDNLESHHVVELADLMTRHSVKSRDDARRMAAVLFDVQNGVTLCQRCHYAAHNRRLCA